MGMREKLMNIVCDGLEDGCAGHCNYPHCYRVNNVVDSLIANGVTIPVRCKDCKNRDDITGECKHPKAVGWDVLIPEDDDFCSYGERRTDADC